MNTGDLISQNRLARSVPGMARPRKQAVAIVLSESRRSKVGKPKKSPLLSRMKAMQIGGC